MLTTRDISRFCLTLIAMAAATIGLAVFSDAAFAQVATGTVSLDAGVRDILETAQSSYVSFRDGAVLAGIVGIVTGLVTITRIGVIDAWIASKNLKWIRIVLGIVLTGVGSAVTLLAEGKDTVLVVVLSIGTALSSPGLAELVKYIGRGVGGGKKA